MFHRKKKIEKIGMQMSTACNFPPLPFVNCVCVCVVDKDFSVIKFDLLNSIDPNQVFIWNRVRILE